MHHVKLPAKFISYVSFGYSQLLAYVKTEQWETPKFNIHKGVFQGDTLSPVIFLLAFNSIIQLCKSLPTCGFHMTLQVPNSKDLPAVNSGVYILSDEINSEEAPGWYYATKKQFFPDGKAQVEYRNLSTETLDLCSTQWKLTRKGQRPYLPLQKSPPNFPLKKAILGAAKVNMCTSTPHTVKGYADDLSVFLSSAQVHACIVKNIDKKTRDLDLSPRSD